MVEAEFAISTITRDVIRRAAQTFDDTAIAVAELTCDHPDFDGLDRIHREAGADLETIAETVWRQPVRTMADVMLRVEVALAVLDRTTDGRFSWATSHEHQERAAFSVIEGLTALEREASHA